MVNSGKLHPHHVALNSLIDKVLAHRPKKTMAGKKPASAKKREAKTPASLTPQGKPSKRRK
jgi:hypothetical protein